MFDFLRNLTKSAEEKRQEQLVAYMDGALTLAERQQFEETLAQDPGLQAELAQQQVLKRLLSQVPQRRVPRNFTLDPAQYGRPAKQPLLQYYPALRAATVLTAVMLFLAVGTGVMMQGGANQGILAPAADIAMNSAESASGATSAEIMVTDVVEVEAEPAPMEEPMAQEELMSEEAADEAVGETAAEEGALPAAASTAVSNFTATKVDESEAGPDAAGNDSELFAVLPTPSPMATAAPQTSSSPRIEATELADRAIEMTTIAESESEAAPLDGSLETAEGESQANERDTAVATREDSPSEAQTINGFSLLIISLVILLVVLLMLTLYARRQLL